MIPLEVIVGTYEEFLLGYKLEEQNGKQVLTQTFADKSHSGAVRCVAVHDHWVATGSADDRIFIYDMRTRKQSQIILKHEGTVNGLAFTPDGTHLLSVSDDGRMIATRLNTWVTEATWKKAHSGSAVTHVSCHPSGKLALSLGLDLVLRTWNLVKGRVAYKTNLKSRNTLGSHPDCLAWSVEGDYFCITGQRIVEIWSIKTADVIYTQKTSAKPVCAAWTSNESCLIGLEDGKIQWISLNATGKKDVVIEAHDARVKSMFFRNDVLVTASSSGEIKVWQLDEKKQNLTEVAVTNIGCRPTCIGILDLEQFGTSYSVVKPAAVEEKQVCVPKMKPKQQQNRGVVTVEYENDEDNNVPDESADGNDDESDESNESEVHAKIAAQADESDSDELDDDESNSDEDGDQEPQIRLPKSRKHKQIINKQKNMKKPRISVEPKKADKKPKGKMKATKKKLMK